MTLISPFVGRIYDWYRKERGGNDIPADEDPGVTSVTRIYNYFKKFDYKTQVMGASFRKVDQIVRLAGCDLLTISPDLLEQMEKTEGAVPRRLSVEAAKASDAQEDPPGREDVPLDAQRGRHGHREVGRRHPQVLRRRPQAGTVRPGASEPDSGSAKGHHPVNDRVVSDNDGSNYRSQLTTDNQPCCRLEEEYPMTTATTEMKQNTGTGSEASAAAPLSAQELRKMHAYWRAANYLSVGQIYLMDNPLLKEPLHLKHVKPRLLGHWGTTPGQNFLYVHLNRVIKLYDLNMLYISGPGHGGPALVANAYLEGTYTEVYPNIGQDEAGLKRLFTQFSFPGGIPSHAEVTRRCGRLAIVP